MHRCVPVMTKGLMQDVHTFRGGPCPINEAREHKPCIYSLQAGKVHLKGVRAVSPCSILQCRRSAEHAHARRRILHA